MDAARWERIQTLSFGLGEGVKVKEARVPDFVLRLVDELEAHGSSNLTVQLGEELRLDCFHANPPSAPFVRPAAIP